MTIVFKYKFYAVGEAPPSWLLSNNHDVPDAMDGDPPANIIPIDSAMHFAVPNSAAIVSAMNVWSNYLDISFSDSLGTKNIAFGGWNPSKRRVCKMIYLAHR